MQDPGQSQRDGRIRQSMVESVMMFGDHTTSLTTQGADGKI
jgi:hypothetical protein